jgi:hypothetical protein
MNAEIGSTFHNPEPNFEQFRPGSHRTGEARCASLPPLG